MGSGCFLLVYLVEKYFRVAAKITELIHPPCALVPRSPGVFIDR
jgi:hypothetical protein